MKPKKTKTFEIEGVQYTVAPLCQAQEDLILDIMGQVGIINTMFGFALADDSDEKEVNLDQVLINLGRRKLIPRFLAVILIPVNKKFDEDELPKLDKIMAAQPVELKFEVWPDFLSVAAKYLKRLKDIFPKIGRTKITEMVMTAADLKSSSISSAEENSGSVN